MLSNTGIADHSPIIGRADERALLRLALDRALAGRGGLALVSGEAGIGKTTLARDLIRVSLAGGCLVLTGACYDLSVTPPYGPWIEALRGYQPSAGQPPAPAWLVDPGAPRQQASQAALFEEARAFFAELSGRQPVLIVLEDLHWADPASIDALRFLSRGLDGSRMLLLISYRDDSLRHGHALLRAIPVLARDSAAQRVELRRWQEPETRAFVSSQWQLQEQDEDRLVSHVQGLAEGNPFFSIELLRALEHDRVLRRAGDRWVLDALEGRRTPPFVREVIERRLDVLSADARNLLEVAATIGQQVPFDLWLSVSGASDEQMIGAVGEAAAAQLVDELPERSGIEFRHALVRETLYAGVVGLRVRAWHRTIAETLARQRLPDPDQVARHFAAAGDERQLEWLLRSAMRARQSAAWFTAVERIEQAANLLESDPSRASDRGWLLYFACFLARYAGDADTVNRYVAEAERLASVANDRELAAYLRFQRGTYRCHRGDIRRGLEDHDAAMATIAELGRAQPLPPADDHLPVFIESLLAPSGSRADLVSVIPGWPAGLEPRLGFVTHWRGHAGRFVEAISVGEHYVATLDASDLGADDGSLYSASCHFGLALSYAGTGRPDLARDSFVRGRQGALQIGDFWAAGLAALAELVFVALPYAADDVESRRQLVDETNGILARAAEQASSARIESPATAIVDLLDGRWNTARHVARRLYDARRPFIMLKAMMAVVLATIDLRQGRPDSAWEYIHAMLPSGAATEPGDSSLLNSLRLQQLAIELALDAGDLERARAWLLAHDAWLAWSGATVGVAEGQLLWARFFVRTGDDDEALRRAGQALRLSSEPRQPLALIACQRLLGELALARRERDSAEAYLSSAAQLAARCDIPFELAMVQLAQAELAVATRDTPRAAELLARARGTLGQHSALPAIARAERIAGTLKRISREYPAGLTPREVEILCLVAEGLSNRAIAERLYLSVRTVERHVTNIFGKIDVHTRSAATSFAHRHGLALPESRPTT